METKKPLKQYSSKPIDGLGHTGTAPQFLPGSLLILKRKVANEAVACWVLVSLAALAGAVVSVLAGEISLAAVGLIMTALADTSSGQANAAAEVLTMFTGMFNIVLGISLALLAPAGIVILAVADYNRNYRMTVNDLIWDNMALLFVDYEYGAMIEQARAERFRLNPNPVQLGDKLEQRLQHFAAYYPQYRRLARPGTELKLPTVVERNCWADGGLLGLATCLSTCCIGVILAVPMIARIAGSWPRQLAIKQAVVHFFEGRFDLALEQQWMQRLG